MYISIDLGGTSTRVASSKDLDTIHKLERFPTDKNLVNEKKLINEAISKVVDGGDVEFICIGVPGIVDRYNRTFKKIVNYPELTGKNYEALFDLNVSASNIVVENDAALAGLAESKQEEVKDSRVVAYLTLSTGFGGIRIQDQKISRVQGNSEPGHMIIVHDGRYDSVCGQKGCVHSYLSGVAFTEMHKVAPSECNDKKIWNDYGTYLATAITNVIAMWDPQIIVLGGSLSSKYDMFSASLHKGLELQTMFPAPKIVISKMGDQNGIFGGFALTRQVLGGFN